MLDLQWQISNPNYSPPMVTSSSHHSPPSVTSNLNYSPPSIMSKLNHSSFGAMSNPRYSLFGAASNLNYSSSVVMSGRRPSHNFLSHRAHQEEEKRSKTREKRKFSDPVKLKITHKEFVKKWNDDRVLPFGRRCLSETTLLVMSEEEIDVDLFGIKHHKRVSFSAPTVKRKSVCPDYSKPTPILLKETKALDPGYPLSHMDYATFRAWRNGETFKQSIDSDSSSETDSKRKPHESALQFLKYVILSCLKR
ncbi:hypothetical protein FO519_003320 [Halicephalobus sp. NKZ332]|nr:hypothetical protein FO519_003320 [Halicephalobus sp. NKZ332]